MIHDNDRVPDSVITLAECLLDQRFATAGFHDGGFLSNHFNIGQGFEEYVDYRGQGFAKIIPDAIEWLARNKDRNFLLFLHTYDVHSPYAPPEPYRGLFLQDLEPPTPGFEPTSEALEEVRLSKYTDQLKVLPDRDLEYAKALYDAEIRLVDGWVGRLMTAVRDLGLDQTATIVVISDHGEEFQEHGSVLHEKLYATVTRVPLMIRLPGGASARRCSSVVEALDLTPTLLELTGTPFPPGMQGESLVPFLRGLDSPETLAFGESPFFGGQRIIANDTYRLLLSKDSGTLELYHFRNDPTELLRVEGAHPEVTDDLLKLITSWDARIQSEARHVDKSPEPIPTEVRENLEALGYLSPDRK